MRISGRGKETYLYLSGLSVDRAVRLSDHADLMPAKCSPLPDDMIAVSRSEIDLGVVVLFLRSVSSQIRVRARSPKELATIAWNTNWDIVLLSAFCGCEVVCNLQCDSSAEQFGSKSQLEVTNYHLWGLTLGQPHYMTSEEAEWTENNIAQARKLLDKPAFQNGVHCLATYRWHSLPRVQLAVLWAGIEGLFGVESEIVFRLSLYIARLLEPSDDARRHQLFANVKRLYNQRSTAVHGRKMKGNVQTGVAESAMLLLRILRACVEACELPRTEALAP